VTALCTQQDSHAAPPAAELDRLVLAAPPMTGAEYLTAQVLGVLWKQLDAAFAIELAESKCGLQDFLKRRNLAWNLVGRVHFNLAEKPRRPGCAFRLSGNLHHPAGGQCERRKHLPLGKALGEYAGAKDKGRLLSLLLPVQRASETCPWLKSPRGWRRDLPPAAVDAPRGHSAFERRLAA